MLKKLTILAFIISTTSLGMGDDLSRLLGNLVSQLAPKKFNLETFRANLSKISKQEHEKCITFIGSLPNNDELICTKLTSGGIDCIRYTESGNQITCANGEDIFNLLSEMYKVQQQKKTALEQETKEQKS